MLIDMFIVLQVVAICMFFLSFFIHGNVNSEILWGLCVITFALLGISAITVQSLEPVYDIPGGYYYIDEYSYVDYSLIGFNLLFFSLSMLFFFLDVFDKYGKTAKGAIK